MSCHVSRGGFPPTKWPQDLMQMQRQKKQNKPFQEAGCILILLEMPCHTTVLQCHPLQQPVVHIIANANGEEAKLITDGILGVAEDFG